MPNEHALGIHATIDVSGALRFGPDVTWVDAINYDVDESAKDFFAEVVSEYFPAIDAAALRPGYAGVRPKVSFAGKTAVDFVIQDSRQHGLPGLINLFGFESPALTASLAIARHVGSLLRS